jgi:hypothetical protein
MSKKIKIVIAIVVMLSLVGSVQATLIWGANSGDWGDLTTWRDPQQIPVANDQAIPFNGQVVDVTDAQACGTLNIGYVYDATVNVAASGNLTTTTMHVGQTAEGNLEVGTFNLYGTAYTGQLLVANERANGRGVLNIYSGGLMTVGTMACSIGNTGTEEGAGGRVNLKGGSMIIDALILMTDNGHIDIEAGTLLVTDDAGGQNQYYIDQYIDDGLITSHGGMSPRCYLIVSSSDGYISVKTGGCTCTTYLPADLTHDCYVDTLDIAFLADNWLACNVPTDPNCVH